MEIYPSIASSNCLEYGKELERLGTWGSLHIDIEDGNFTPNITFGLKTVRAICSATAASCIQVHLMTTDPEGYIDELHSYGVTEISAHIEALLSPLIFIDRCHELGMKAGLALKTRTPLDSVRPYLKSVDQLLFLTSEPINGRNEEFYFPAFERALSVAHELPGHIECVADGGLTETRIRLLADAGFSGVVVGRLLFSNDDYLGMLNHLKSMKGGNIR